MALRSSSTEEELRELAVEFLRVVTVVEVVVVVVVAEAVGMVVGIVWLEKEPEVLSRDVVVVVSFSTITFFFCVLYTAGDNLSFLSSSPK